MTSLSDKQIEILKRTWQLPIANKVESGTFIFLKFFTKYPHNQDTFPDLRNKPIPSLRGTPELLIHINNLMGVLNQTITTIEDEKAMIETHEVWLDVAKSHREIKVSKQAFLEIKEVILESLVELCNLNEEEEKAWEALIAHAYKTIIFPVILAEN